MRAVMIVPAAGRGARMTLRRPKALIPLLGKPLLAWTIERILDAEVFSEILVACPPQEREHFGGCLTEQTTVTPPTRLIGGGETRQESVSNCLCQISDEFDLIAVHDGARPLVTTQILMDVVNRANETGAAIAAVPCKDTVKLCSERGIVSETLDRSRVWLVQTPQCFHRSLLINAYEKAKRDGFVATDDAALVERTGVPVHVVMGSYENIKVTTPEDIPLCEEILRRRQT